MSDSLADDTADDSWFSGVGVFSWLQPPQNNSAADVAPPRTVSYDTYWTHSSSRQSFPETYYSKSEDVVSVSTSDASSSHQSSHSGSSSESDCVTGEVQSTCRGESLTTSGSFSTTSRSMIPRVLSTTPLQSLRFCRSWDVTMPPGRKHHICGRHVVPTIKRAARLFAPIRRRISLEIHGSPVFDERNLSSGQGPIRSDLMDDLLNGRALLSTSQKQDVQLNENDKVLLRILHAEKKKPETTAKSRKKPVVEDDMSSMSSMGFDDVGFVEEKCYNLANVSLFHLYGRTIEMQTGLDRQAVYRIVHFGDEKDAWLFQEILEFMESLMTERAVRLKRVKP